MLGKVEVQRDMEGGGGVLFARAKADGTNAVMQKAHASIRDADMDGTIARFSDAFVRQFGARLMVPIEKVRAFADLPQAILASAAAQGVKVTAPGVFYDGKVYVVQENHRNATELEKMIFHEMFGHAAVRTLFADDYNGHLNTLLTRIGGWEGLRTLAVKNNIDLSKYINGCKRTFRCPIRRRPRR